MTDLTIISQSPEDGIYFGMPEEEYHTIPRLSASGIKTLNFSPAEFWEQSWMNSEREEERDTKARLEGKAYHKIILEGLGAFTSKYAVRPSKDDHPNALDGAEALCIHAETLGLKKSGTIGELCQRIREADQEVELWPEIMSAFLAANEGREIISANLWSEIQRTRRAIDRMPPISGAFTDGASEVSILWTDATTGVQLKARIDYIKPDDGILYIIDLKTFSNFRDRPIDQVPVTEISHNSYFVQPVVYTDAIWSVIKTGESAFKTDAPEKLKQAILSAKNTAFDFVFVRTGKATEAKRCGFRRFDHHAGNGLTANQYWTKGEALFRQGVNLFSQLMKTMGPEEPWSLSRDVQILGDHHFPLWALETPDPLEIGRIK